MISPARYFIPVCLYPHTKYRTRTGVTDLFEKYELRSHPYLIVVADRLLVLDRLVTGRYWTLASAVVKARREASQIVRLIRRIAYKAGAVVNGRIVYWNEVAETAQFAQFAQHMQQGVLADGLLAEGIEQFVERRVERFGLGSAPDRERNYEREYLLSEICMSVFCTEILGFSTEVWERAPAIGVPDPLRLLYCEKPDLVADLIGRPPARVLRFLYDDAPQPAAGNKYQGVAQA
jgi:hypothetical protein